MMYSYTGGRNYAGQLTNDTTSGNLTNLDSHINNNIGRVLRKHPWPFLFREGTVSTVANVQTVEVPANLVKVTSVVVETGTTRWTPHEVPNRDFWDRLNYTIATAHTADFPTWWYYQQRRIHFWPTPSTARTVTITGRIGFSRLNIADYTTGTILTTTVGSARVVGSSTVWTTGMGGRYLRITGSDTNNKGDDEWYEISSVTSGTQLDLVKLYRGAAIASGTAAYTIGQMSPIPDGYQEAPIYRAVETYHASKSTPGSSEKMTRFGSMAAELENQMESDYGYATDNVVVEGDGDFEDDNPNLYVRT